MLAPDAEVVTSNPSNRFAQNFAREAEALGRPVAPIIDVHSHIHGERATRVFGDICMQYGIELIYSMTRLRHVDTVKAILGNRVRFIATPDFTAEDKHHAFGAGYIDEIEAFHAKGARMTKFWVAPRGRDIAIELGDDQLFRLDGTYAREAMAASRDLGMCFMTHVADPDTWFEGKYNDPERYGTKRDQYEPLEEMLDEHHDVPWIAAHMGGWPEDLEFLSGLLDRHDNLHLDTSAAKWMLREISKHSRDDIVDFLTRYNGRILFGSDIVTIDEHFDASATEGMAAKANGEQQAYDLYASRYWALRAMWETDYDGESPIADPDLHMLDPERYSTMDAPAMCGHSLPKDLLRSLYHDAAQALLDPWFIGNVQR